ncbi:MAG TPA: protein-tyrosine phosphatase family protein, partial [Gammaproteobacteria bacterium]|nr:protein-tyrosine phosphatase family protein [Gammaproteobacteria bacterium]
LEANFNIKFDRKQSSVLDSIFQSFIGAKHIEKVAHDVGGKYAAITISGKAHQPETQGFNPGDATKGRSSNKRTTDGDGFPTVALYYGHNKNITQQMVIQSGSTIVGGESGLINLTNGDLNAIVSFYNDTISKNIPVVVNCTDGIDRTGVIMAALQILHAYKTGKDITQLLQTQQQQEMLTIIDDLRRDRGPKFLQGTEYVAMAVTLGYSLVQTQKQIEFQEKNHAKLVELIPTYKDLDPVVLQQEIKKTLNKKLLKSSDKQLLKDWNILVRDRNDASNQFDVTNADEFCKLFRNFGVDRKKVDQHLHLATVGTHEIDKAPISKYNEALKAGFDIGSYYINGQNIYNFAIKTLRAKPDEGDNAAEFARLLHHTVKMKDKTNLTVLKNELANFGYSEMKMVKNALVDYEKKHKDALQSDFKNGLKALNKLLPSDKQAQANDKKIVIDQFFKSSWTKELTPSEAINVAPIKTNESTMTKNSQNHEGANTNNGARRTLIYQFSQKMETTPLTKASPIPPIQKLLDILETGLNALVNSTHNDSVGREALSKIMQAFKSNGVQGEDENKQKLKDLVKELKAIPPSETQEKIAKILETLHVDHILSKLDNRPSLRK